MRPQHVTTRAAYVTASTAAAQALLRRRRAKKPKPPPIIQDVDPRVVLQGDLTAGTEVQWTVGSDDSVTASLVRRHPYVLDEEYGDPVRTVSSTSLTDIYSVALAADTLPGGAVVVEMKGDILQNSGGDQTGRLAVTLGGTTYADGTVSLTGDADRYGFWFRVELSARADGSQFLVCRSLYGQAAAATTGTGNLGASFADGLIYNAGVTEDQTGSLTLALRWAFGTSTTNSEVRVYHTRTEIV